MTSIILSHKLLSVKLCSSEFTKIKRQRVNNEEEKCKIINSLKKVIDEQECHKTCRLCLKPGLKWIFDRHEDFDFVYNIKYILGIEVSETDGKPQFMCNVCEKTLREAERLKETAVTTQWRLQQELDMVSNVASDKNITKPSFSFEYFTKQKAKILHQWTCKKCKQHFLDKNELILHKKQPPCRTDKFFICELCGKKFKTISMLNRHRLMHTGERPHACAQCPYRATTSYALRAHARAHASARAARCDRCGVHFGDAAALSSHRRRHGPPTMPCRMCDASFRFQASLKNHMSTHHNAAKPHKCQTCGKCFFTRRRLGYHERRVHGSE